ncbi:MAG TPA: MMPL family transporter [Candidatus Thalassarchaeaceae archaeon]|mgnify:CR=1 FL=1|nr:MMPL family transporter [Candidatus Thalassarchaeaceae archaeon]
MAGGTGYRKDTFYRMGLFSHDRRMAVIAISIAVFIGLGSLIATGNEFTEAFDGDEMESYQAHHMITEAFASNDSEGDSGLSGGRVFTIIFAHDEWNASNPQFADAVNLTIAGISDSSTIEYIQTPWNVDSNLTSWHYSDDGSHMRIEVGFSADTDAKEAYRGMKDDIKCGDLSCWRTGDVAIDATFDDRMVEDLFKAEMLAAPLTIILLIIVFSSIVAALLPVAISIPTVISGVGIIYWLSNQMDVNNYAMNIVSLIGIGVSIDYSLFIVNRFREELLNGHDKREALAITSATAGKAVFFSGVTVMIGLSGMLFFEGTGLPSMGIGGALAVALAVFFSTTFLMAILSILGENVNRFKVPFGMKHESGEDGMWFRLADFVMRRPVITLVPILILLIGAGAPFLNVQLGLAGIDLLAPDEEVRVGSEIQEEEWADFGEADIFIAFDLQGANRYSNETIDTLHNLSTSIAERDDVSSVFSIYYPNPDMNASNLKAIYSLPTSQQPVGIQELVNATSTEEIIIIRIVYLPEPGSPEAHTLVRDVRHMEDEISFQGKVGGWAAISVDVIEEVHDKTPIAVTYILLCTGVLIFIQVRSVLIPLKAMVMNILSLTASFGMLVFVFQEGHGFEDLMNFTPLSVDPTTPVIMFCIVFGLSMDYEVLMLSRIHEAYLETGDNTEAVRRGLQQTGRLITGAAAVMVVVFASFAIAKVQIIKAIGLGLALAIAIDATLVRAFVVPATMRLLGDLNWWSPKWLAKWFPPQQPNQEEE